MKPLFAALIFLLLQNLTFGQKIYRANRDAYKTNKFEYAFYLFNDSSCFLKGHYLDNSKYFLYKGKLIKTNDTLYHFLFKPIANFDCNKGIHGGDSLRFNLTEVDTILSSYIFTITKEVGHPSTIELEPGLTTVYVKGSENHVFFMDSKFIDPISKKKILIEVGVNSDPVLTYYGTKIESGTIQVSITKNILTIYPDHKFVQDIDTFILKGN